LAVARGSPGRGDWSLTTRGRIVCHSFTIDWASRARFRHPTRS
jgi:hypothetical protein